MDELSASVLPRLLAERYEVDREIARGGMAIVYLARDLRHHRRVAIKVLRPELASPAVSERFLREIDIAAHLTHPNILPVHDSGAIDDLPYYVMPFVEGETLRDRLDGTGAPLTFDEVVRITLEIADALAYAHARGLIHRDIKPENILFVAGHAVIGDFGIAHLLGQDGGQSLTQTGVAIGTLAYMSPEQAIGSKALDARSDLYSLGCVLHEMLAAIRQTGTQSGGRATAVMNVVVNKALAREPGDRYDSMAQFRDAIIAATAPARGQRRRAAWIAGIAALLVAGVVAPTVAWKRGHAPIRVAVLPFANLSGDTTQDYFSDGLTEEMISQLGEIAPERLLVIRRTSTLRDKHRVMRLDSVARELRAQYVLAGSVRREGDRIRIAAELVRASDQAQVWAERYDRDLRGILDVQSGVAQGVTQSLALRLAPTARRRRVEPGAYEAYLNGQEHNGRLNRADLETALRYYDRALEIDSSYAPAYAGIARAWGGLQQMGFAAPAVAHERMRRALDRAFALDSTSAIVHHQLAAYYVWSDWDWRAGDLEFRRAYALNPNDPQMLSGYAHFSMIMKRPDDAFKFIRRALELDPLNPQVRAFYATMLFTSNRPRDALEQLREVQRTVPNMQMVLNQIPNILYSLGDTAGALREERAAFLTRHDTTAVEALDAGAATGGYTGAMRRVADLLADRCRTTGAGAVGVAGHYRRAGDYDRAVAWLERAVELRDPNVPYINVAAGNASFSKDARFRALIARLRLP